MSSNNLSGAQRLLRLSKEEREEIINSLTPEEQQALLTDWTFLARPNQLQPKGRWFIWLIRSGRGAGKTRTGAEFVVDRVKKGFKRIALVGQTKADCRDTMVELEQSSILKVCPPSLRPSYSPSKRRITFAAGATATTFSGDEPDQLRGPQFDTAWVDELCKFKFPRECWDNLMFSLRLGKDPKVVVTTTPRPIPLLKEIMSRKDCIDVRYSTYGNIDNLSDLYIKNLRETYDGTRLGQQEIHGKILEDNPDALWKSEQIEALRVTKVPELKKIMTGVDPAVTSSKKSNETGIVVCGKGTDGHFYVLDDRSLKASPDKWARAAIAAHNAYKGDKIIAEANQGGDLVESTLRTVDANVPFKKVCASRGKVVRAEPISALYEQGKVHHVGTFADLETQMTDWNPLEDTYSPDRVDALVWALSELSGRSSRDFSNIDMSVNVTMLRRESPNAIGDYAGGHLW